MNYKVTVASYVLGHKDLGPIPGTKVEKEFDTDDGIGQTIWHGYLQMRQLQKEKPLAENDPYKIKLTEKDKEIDKFREAINLFYRFLAGEGRDNYVQVFSIKEAEQNDKKGRVKSNYEK